MMNKAITILFSLLAFTGCEIPGVISSYYAKEYCSCHFVMKQGDDYCHEHASQIIGIKKKVVDESRMSVTAWALGKEYTATYQGMREGCLITDHRD